MERGHPVVMARTVVLCAAAGSLASIDLERAERVRSCMPHRRGAVGRPHMKVSPSTALSKPAGACPHAEGLRNLDGVAGGPAKRRVHGGDLGGGADAVGFPEPSHGLRELPGLAEALRPD